MIIIRTYNINITCPPQEIFKAPVWHLFELSLFVCPLHSEKALILEGVFTYMRNTIVLYNLNQWTFLVDHLL